MSLPFVVDLTVRVPSEEGSELCPVSVKYSGVFTSSAKYKLELSGSGTKTLDFGTIGAAGAKLVLVKLSTGTDPILVYVNGSATFEEISVGGAKFLLSPSPANGITSLVVEHTSSVRGQVLLLG